MPRTFRKVSCCPANDASGRSSAVADERTATLPVVVLTSSGEQEDLLTSYRNGANSYIRKPVDFNAFAKLIRTVARYWIEINQASSQ